MRMVDLILKKRSAEELTKEEIKQIIDGYVAGEIPDYQMSALMMSIYFNGMSKQETADLTMAIVQSGEQLDLSAINGLKVDKHSTGGVGDTTSLVLGPLVAAAGVPVAKMSGRGLGHTGGTIDKLESISGFHTELTNEAFVKQVNDIKLALVGQTANLTPADKLLYSLRDVTATVDSIPLIASSIMSKKIAAGADAIVLDVKTGSGAFMKSKDNSFELAKAMVDIGAFTNKETIAVISDMNQPLGYAVGNALEVQEAIDTLKGEGPKDLEELCLTLGSHMLKLGKRTNSFEEGYRLLKDIIDSGKAIQVLKDFVKAQGGDPNYIDNPALLPQATNKFDIVAEQDGFIQSINALDIGISAMMLGAGRETKKSTIDLAVGIKLNKKVNDPVKKGDKLAVLYVNNQKNLQQVKEKVTNSFLINSNSNGKLPLIYGVVSKEGIQYY